MMNKLGKKARASLILWCLVLAPFFLYYLWGFINIPKMVEYGNPTRTGFIIYCIAYLVSPILAAAALTINIEFFSIAGKEKEITGIAPKGYKTLLLLLIVGPIVSIILFSVGFVVGFMMWLAIGGNL
jgi:hypothetical protein